MKHFFLFIVLAFSCMLGLAQTTRVKVGDLYYNLSGATASVTTSDVIPSDCRSIYPSKYTKDIYVIPAYITYEGLEYEVVSIDRWAFAGFRNDLYASPKVQGATGSTAHTIILPSTIKRIGESAFANCTNLTKMVIPANVESLYTGYYDYHSPFYNTPLLRELIYLSSTPPSGWYATSKTYVANPMKYTTPAASITDASILPILSSNNTFVYSGTFPILNLTNNLSGYNLDYEPPVLQKNVGSYTLSIEAHISNEYSKYDSNIIVPYTISPVAVTVSTPNISREYGEPNPDFQINYEGLVNNESVDVFESRAIASTSAKQTSSVGTYTITVSGAKALNYTFTYTQGELTVLPAPLSASINSTSREYGNSNPNFSLSFEGLKNGESVPAWIESPKFITTATMTSPVGEYPITATATPKNYELNSISDGVLTILPAKLKVIAQNKSRLYYEENPEFTFYYSGFRNGETESIVSNAPSLTTAATKESNSGKYDISISNITAPNYEIQYQTGVLTINPRNLSVNTGIYERSYGEENPAFELTYDGFVSGQNESDLTTPPTAYTNATNTTSVGSYPIYIGGGVAQNYSFSYSQGKLNIVKAEQDIIWNQDLTNLAKGQQVELLAYSTSGLPITYAIDIDNATVCEVYSVGNKKYLDCIGEGEVQLRATQEGNSNYYSSPRVSKTIIVGGSTPQKPILSIVQLPVGSITTPVNWGSIFAFTLQPNSGWKINAISINGEDFTNRLDKNGTFTTPAITKDSKIIISYEDENASVQDIECSKPKIIGYDGGIKVSNASLGLSVYIYSVEGYLIKSTVCESDEVLIPLSNNATYIVKLGNFTGKIRL